MEAVAERINNSLSHSKESIPITITGRITDKSGVLIEQLEEPIKLDESANYHVYLNDFTSWSNVPNVTEGNRYFYCEWMDPKTNGKIIRKIKFPISTQSIDTYNDFLQSEFEKHEAF